MAEKPSLADLTYYANRSQGGVGAEELTSERARAALAAAQAYDPGASWREVFGGDGQSLGYTLDFDASKLPGVDNTGLLGHTSGHGSGADYQIPFSTVQPHMTLADPNAVTQSPVYGRVTDNRNIQQQDDWIARWGGPALVAAFAFGAPTLASLMSNGAIGAGASGAAAGGSIGMSPDELATTGMSGNSGFSGELAGAGAGATSTGIDLSPGAFGMSDRGLGTTINGGLGAGSEGTLSAMDIAGLGPTGNTALDTLLTGARYIARSPLLQAAGKIPQLLGGGAAGGAGGGGMSGRVGGGLLGGGAPSEDATSILAKFYGLQSMNPLLDPRLRAMKDR